MPAARSWPLREVLEAAASAGKLAACDWLPQQGCPMGFRPLEIAAGYGQQAACGWLLAHGCPKGRGAVHAAARGGHMGLAEMLLGRRVHSADSDDEALAAAVAEGCDLPTLQRFCQDLRPHPEEAREHVEPQLPQQLKRGKAIIAAAARSPTPDWRDKVGWLEAQGCRRDGEACKAAATCPDALDRLVWLREQGYPVDNFSMAEVAQRSGNLAALEYLLANTDIHGVTIDPLVVASNGHLELLKVLLALQRYRMNAGDVAVAAARRGHLHVVAWLVEEEGVDEGGRLLQRYGARVMGAAIDRLGQPGAVEVAGGSGLPAA
ncbi:hypothetical protein Agub_g6143 [Astrephomene gubernaculifera]|uniref:Ankyrin repeat domain-containing protein n=1 Tax=Astrephomene gubernaculifera TaxID=47775 RepID=A0AAD3DPZ1_9CHLO|nr:hypothetical protein Agub_g6143 [Astrephomene gubernaculifera]